MFFFQNCFEGNIQSFVGCASPWHITGETVIQERVWEESGALWGEFCQVLNGVKTHPGSHSELHDLKKACGAVCSNTDRKQIPGFRTARAWALGATLIHDTVSHVLAV